MLPSAHAEPSPRASRIGCAACHAEAAAEWTESAHADIADCATCHPAAAAMKDGAHDHPPDPPRWPSRCTSCHAPAERAPLRTSAPLAEPDCSGCHFPVLHRPSPRQETRPPARTYPDRPTLAEVPPPSAGRSHALIQSAPTRAAAAFERRIAEAVTLRIVRAELDGDQLRVQSVVSTGSLPHPIVGSASRPLRVQLTLHSADGQKSVTATEQVPSGRPGIPTDGPTTLTLRVSLPAPPEVPQLTVSLVRSDPHPPDAALQSASLLASDTISLSKGPTLSPRWQAIAAHAALLRGDPDEAARWVSALPAAHPDGRLLDAAVLAQQGHFAEAHNRLRSRPRAHWWDPDQQALLAQLSTALDEPGRALAHWQNAAVMQPTNPTLLRGWAQAARAAGHTDRARAIEHTLHQLGHPTTAAESGLLSCATVPSTCPRSSHIVLPAEPSGR